LKKSSVGFAEFESLSWHPNKGPAIFFIFFRNFPGVVASTGWNERHEPVTKRRKKMTGFNRVVLIGNLTRDPQLRQIPSGTSVAELGLATNERYRNREGELAESTCFVDVVAWGKQAETCDQYLSKGAPILVEGRLQFDQWLNSEGQKRSKLRVRADRIRFMGRASSAQGDRAEGSPAPAAQETPAVSTDESDDNLPF